MIASGPRARAASRFLLGEPVKTRVWGIILGSVLVAAGLEVFELNQVSWVSVGPKIPLMVCFLGFLAAAHWQIKVPMPGLNTYNFDISEVVLFVAVLSNPLWLAVGTQFLALLGCCLLEKRGLVRALSNASNYVITAALGLTVFYKLADLQALASGQTLIALGVSMLVIQLATSLLMGIAVFAATGKHNFKNPLVWRLKAQNTLLTYAVVGIVFGLWGSAPWLASFLLGFLGFLAYLFKRVTYAAKQQFVLEQMLRTSNFLQASQDIRGQMAEFLGLVREIEVCAVAQLLLNTGEDFIYLSESRANCSAIVMEPEMNSGWKEYWAKADGGSPVFFNKVLRGGGFLGDYLSDELFATGMVVPVRGQKGVLGSLVLGDRPGRLGKFTKTDGEIAGSIGLQLGAALENGFLAEELARLNGLTEALQARALVDPLTGLANRTALDDRLKFALARACRYKTPIGLLFLDLDGFKEVNDKFLHSAGDELLIRVGERLRACVRETDLPVRLSGDEFVVLLESPEGIDDAKLAAQRILSAVAEPFSLDDDKLAQVGVSIGLAYAAEPRGVTPEGLRKCADAAMYAAKQAGKGQVVCSVLEAPSEGSQVTTKVSGGRSAVNPEAELKTIFEEELVLQGRKLGTGSRIGAKWGERPE